MYVRKRRISKISTKRHDDEVMTSHTYTLGMNNGTRIMCEYCHKYRASCRQMLFFRVLLLLTFAVSVSPLPSFAFDYSEVAISSVIERSYDERLHLAVFMVGHKALSYMPQMPFLAINASSKQTMHAWQKVSQSWSHQKIPTACFCVLKHTATSTAYVSQGGRNPLSIIRLCRFMTFPFSWTKRRIHTQQHYYRQRLQQDAWGRRANTLSNLSSFILFSCSGSEVSHRPHIIQKRVPSEG